MPRYQHDPRWINVRYAASCCRCGRRINKGDRAFYFPNGRDLFCDGPDCGQNESNQFDCHTADEAIYNGSAY